MAMRRLQGQGQGNQQIQVPGMHIWSFLLAAVVLTTALQQRCRFKTVESDSCLNAPSSSRLRKSQKKQAARESLRARRKAKRPVVAHAVRQREKAKLANALKELPAITVDEKACECRLSLHPRACTGWSLLLRAVMAPWTRIWKRVLFEIPKVIIQTYSCWCLNLSLLHIAGIYIYNFLKIR